MAGPRVPEKRDGYSSVVVAARRLVVAGTALHAEEINWQEAVARLAPEHTQAEASVRMLKKYGDAASIDRGSLAYAHAKADYDGIIAGLTVALAQRQPPRPTATASD